MVRWGLHLTQTLALSGRPPAGAHPSIGRHAKCQCRPLEDMVTLDGWLPSLFFLNLPTHHFPRLRTVELAVVVPDGCRAGSGPGETWSWLAVSSSCMGLCASMD